MKTIYFLKIFSYDPTEGKYSKFRGYCQSTLGLSQPKVNKYQKIKLGPTMLNPIFTSPLLRAKQTANYLAAQNNLQVKLTEDLAEVKFDLGQLVTEEEYQSFGSKLVRQRFIDAFIHDQLHEPRRSIQKRFQSLLSLFNQLPDGDYLAISHSFFMKLLYIYLTYGDIFKQPELLTKHFLPDKKTFDFGKGFEIRL